MGKKHNDKKSRLRAAHTKAVDILWLLQNPDLLPLHEPERKLDALDGETLDEVVRDTMSDPAYTLVNDPSRIYVPKGILLPPPLFAQLSTRPAHSFTPRRDRVYYDTRRLAARRNGAEVRIQFPKETDAVKARPYQQVIKIGHDGTPTEHTLNRLEFSSDLRTPCPDFEAKRLQGSVEASTYLKTHIDPQDMRPLQLLSTVRDRFWAWVNHAPDTLIEFGVDKGFGVTITGHIFPILQIEPEVKQGDERVLEFVEQRLMERFPDRLTLNLRSKAAPGFDHLEERLNFEAGCWIEDNLVQEEFRLVSPQECPALYMDDDVDWEKHIDLVGKMSARLAQLDMAA